MGDILSEFIMMGINTLLNGLVICAAVALFATVTILNSTVSDQEASNARLKEYAEYNQYDNTHVYQQDIITAIYQYRGDPAVKVDTGSGTFQWSLTHRDTDYSTTAIAALLPQDTYYDADIERSANGAVIGILFKKCNGHCGR